MQKNTQPFLGTSLSQLQKCKKLTINSPINKLYIQLNNRFKTGLDKIKFI